MRKIRQTFHVSNMLEELVMYSDMIESGDTPSFEIMDRATKIGLILMAGYPKEYFLPDEIEFVSKFMSRLGRYATENGDYNEFQ